MSDGTPPTRTNPPCLDREEFAALYQQHYRTIWVVAASATRDAHAAEDLTQEAAIVGLARLDTFRPGGSFSAWMCEIVRRLAKNYGRKQQSLDRRHRALRDQARQNSGGSGGGAPGPGSTGSGSTGSGWNGSGWAESGSVVRSDADGTDGRRAIPSDQPTLHLVWDGVRERTGDAEGDDAAQHRAADEHEASDRGAVVNALSELSEVARSCVLLRVVLEHSYAEIATILGIREATVRSHVFRSRNRLAQVVGGSAKPRDGAGEEAGRASR